jgi:hypothetical protein
MSTTLTMRLRGKFARSAAHRGIALTLLYMPVAPVAKLAVAAWERTPGRRRLSERLRREAEEFDRVHNVDTAGLIDIRRTEVVGENREHGFHYLGTDPSQFRDVIGSLPISHDRYVFVDYGSGKGKALLLASEWPFKAVRGVEFVPELHRIAEANLAGCRDLERRCGDARSLCMDATEFELPTEPAVLFFFNPFSERILSRILERVGRSLAETPRDLWIYYEYQYAHRPLDRAHFLELAFTKGSGRVYRSRPR